jgi:very-short-patch-repair endonuclease
MKIFYDNHLCCIDCSSDLINSVYQYSTKYLGLPLCMHCQLDFKTRSEKASSEALQLYIALRQKGISAELEKWDGFKTIDIAVTSAKVNIEVDGMQHHYNTEQALADLKRTFHAFQKGYLTLRIPNTLVRENIEETAEYIASFLQTSAEKLRA